jgi:hypothetical protein
MITLLPIDVPRVAVLDGALTLGIRGEARVLAALRSVACAVLPAWVDLGASGGYAVGRIEVSRVALAAPLNEFRQGADQLLQTRAVDPRAFQIVRSAMLWQAARRLLERDGVELVDEERRAAELQRLLGDASLVVYPAQTDAAQTMRLPGADPSGDESEVDLYPTPSESMPYKFVRDPQPGKLRRCVVTFSKDVDAPVVKALSDTIAPWVALLELGGFEQPTAFPGIRTCSFGGVQVYERDSAEIVVDRFDAAEGAWSVLANGLSAFALLHPIFSVEVC